MKTMQTLLRREFWENRGAFLTTPIVVGGLFILATILAMTATSVFVTKVNGQEFVLSQFTQLLADVNPEELEYEMDSGLLALVTIFNLVATFVVFFYLLGSLYDDRKDRSILFWRSLPVSDFQTAMSKLLSAVVVVPVLSLSVWLATALILMILASIPFIGSEASALEYLWGPADPLRMYFSMLVASAVQALWMLPIWGWAIFCSAFAKSKPFLWATFLPFMIYVLEKWLSFIRYFNFSGDVFGSWLSERLFAGSVPILVVFDGDFDAMAATMDAARASGFPVDLGAILGRLATSSMWTGVAIGAALIAAAIYIRRYRDDT